MGDITNVVGIVMKLVFLMCKLKPRYFTKFTSLIFCPSKVCPLLAKGTLLSQVLFLFAPPTGRSTNA